MLANRCYECHGEKKQKGGLRVDHIAHLKAGGDTGRRWFPAKSMRSPMIEAIRYKNSDFEMPPKEKLPDEGDRGARKVGRDGRAVAGSRSEANCRHRRTDSPKKSAQFWSFQPLADPKPPEVQGEWVRNDIDRFVAKKHAELQLDPAPEADRRRAGAPRSISICTACRRRRSKPRHSSRYRIRRLTRSSSIAARQPALRRALGAALAGSRALCGERWLQPGRFSPAALGPIAIGSSER